MSWQGMNRETGIAITDIEHIWQSCRDIITTLVGTRISRREYGSLLPELIDHPANGANMLRLRAATVIALSRWEKRIEIKQVNLSINLDQGGFLIDLDATRVDRPQAGTNITLNIPIGNLR